MMVKRVNVARYDEGKSSFISKEDYVAVEVPLHIFLNSIFYVTILCSPVMLEELVVGHLFGEGVVKSLNNIVELRFDEENRCFVTLRKSENGQPRIISRSYSRLITSACGSVNYDTLSNLLENIRFTTLPSWSIKANVIVDCVKQLNKADTFRLTGAVHVAAMFNHSGKLIGLAEDVGRHNAVDKLIGLVLKEAGKDKIKDGFLAVSGRLTGDIVLKAATVGIPIVSSLSAAIHSGLEVAKKTGITLIGFVRGRRMNIYCNENRIIL